MRRPEREAEARLVEPLELLRGVLLVPLLADEFSVFLGRRVPLPRALESMGDLAHVHVLRVEHGAVREHVDVGRVAGYKR